MVERDGMGEVNTTDLEVFLLCFELTAERFGPRLPLPFHSHDEESVTLSCVLYQRNCVFLLIQRRFALQLRSSLMRCCGASF